MFRRRPASCGLIEKDRNGAGKVFVDRSRPPSERFSTRDRWDGH